MANMTRPDPLNSLRRFDSFGMDELLRDWWGRPWNRDVELAPQIRMDVAEDGQAYTVKAEVPGVNKEDVHVEIDGNQVSISAEVKQESEQKNGEKPLRTERYYGRQFRSFSLAHDIDEAKAQATYNNGVLELKLPKKQGTTRKQLEVR